MDQTQELAKEQAGRHAATYVEAGMRVGLGTGSTVRHTILALAEQSADIVCVATSTETHDLAASHGLRVEPPDAVGALDMAIDGADEVDPDLNLTKGGGGALTREKLVAQMAARFLVVVDESKLVDHLGHFGTPLEVLPFAPGVVATRIRELGASQVTVRGTGSDNGNLLMDASFGEIRDPAGLSQKLDAVAGLVEHGIFLADLVDRVIVAGAGGIREMERRR